MTGQTAKIVNDFTIMFSTINGSGSATANMTLLRALFKMGIPVSGKNIFPSNIQGQPTWYYIRLNKDGFVARSDLNQIVVAMNGSTFTRDVEAVAPGGVLFYNEEIQTPVTRTDIISYPMPVKKLVKDLDLPQNLRDYIANMAYVGILAQMLGIDLAKIFEVIDFNFKGKKKAVDSNFAVVETGAKWAAENLSKKDPYAVEAMKATEGMIMSNGNTAAALGAIYGGLQFAAWYPITPATDLAEDLNVYMPMLRKDPQTGKNTFAIVQTEDELAAIGMVVGAGWAGLRSMTSTSGPGLSLMAEYLSLAYYAEVPLVIWNVQRVGPSTGMPTRTAQGDITLANFIGHGDTQFVLLFPSSVEEAFEFGWKALDLAERLQTPVIVLSDLDLGMNHWMSKKFVYPDRPIDRGKVLWETDIEAMLAKGAWGRYLDIDGDGIPYRTLPGNSNPKSAYLARGTGHDEYARYTEDPQAWERGLERINTKFQTAKTYVPCPEIETIPGAKFGIIACGTTDLAIREARSLMAKNGIASDYLRVRAAPFCQDVSDFIAGHEHCYVVELNRDGQLKQLLTLEAPQHAGHLRKVTKIDGWPLTAQWVMNTILSQEEN